MKLSNRQILQKWDSYRRNLERATPVPTETVDEKEKRVKSLLKDFKAFSKYYFPNYASAEFGKFHSTAVNRIIKHDTIYGVHAYAREHAKSVVFGLLVPFFEMFNGRMDNMMLVSHNKDNAVELLMPIMINLESNQRIINDFGKQKGFRGWEVGNFVTINGQSFRAIGAGQSPRGSRNEEKRPDFILIDDIDTDEESRNQARIDKKWQWVEQALFPCMSITGRKRFLFNGNIISKNSCIVKAMKVADYSQVVNILDKDGKPSWYQRYSLDQVNYMLSKISYASGQKEYFNNPINEGSVFKEITWGKVPPLSRLKFAVAYCDPSYKSSKKNDFKAVVLIGEYKGDFFVFKAFLEQTTVAQMIKWFFDLDTYVENKCTLYNYVECGGLQDTFYQEIFLPRLRDIGTVKKKHLSISRDDRKKTDKFTRIEATLEPLNRQGRLIFNEKEKENPHMRRLEEQFKAIEPKLSAHDDGPDATEGGVWIINNKLALMAPPVVVKAKRTKHKY